ncbi:toprim domain-containing protein [Nocardia tengchongensis]|uniref:toprim domain-containing protein n=1 Tax=Nocardia tengchongensis TaxID=2055889 RepID=UPI0036B9C190
MSTPAPNRASRARVRAPAREADRNHGSFETITGALEQTIGPGRPSGAWTRYCCPAHEADGGHHRPSLGVKYDAGQQRTVVRCFAGCDNDLVLDKLGLRVADMFDRRPPRTDHGSAPRPRARQATQSDRAIDAAGLPLSKPKKDLGQQVSTWKTTATYAYTRADGSIAGEVIRHEAAFEHGRDKRFHQRARTETGWTDTGFEHLPFRLPRVLEAIDEHHTVYVCEGEKDVLAAEAAGLTATTNAGGASAWTPEHAAWLRGAGTVVIVADRDAPGYRRAERVMASLVGLVGRVRVVQAATGKDLHEHLQAGHEVGELEPVPHLDPFTPTGPAPTPETPAAETDPVSAAPSAQEGPAPMTSHAYGANPHTSIDRHDEVDHIAGQWRAFMQMLMQYLIAAARRHLEANRQAAEEAAAKDAEQKAQAEAKQATDRAAAEGRIRKLREKGFENASRAEIAQAVADAVAYAPDSETARKALVALKVHVKDRYGIEIDALSGQVTSEAAASPDLAVSLAAADADRASQDRVNKARDHMVEMIAREGLDESVKEELYGEIEKWRTNPSAARLSELTKKLADNGVGKETVTKVRFVASYLGTPGQQPTSSELGTQPDAITSVVATTELRKLPAPLVDLGEDAKPDIDKLFVAYQDRLKTGNKRMIAETREKLNQAIAVLTPEDQAKARARGNDIRKNPAGRFAKLWPEHVDRDELAAQVRAYALMAPQAEAAAVRANSIDDATATSMRKQVDRHHKAITSAITQGKGLHQLEKDQLVAVLRDVDAGKTSVPEVLFADDRSAAAHDADRSVRIAHNAAHAHRRHVEKLLDTNAVPGGTVRRTRDELTQVMDVQAAMAAGRASLSDYEHTRVAQKFDARLADAAVSQPMRNRVSAHLLTAAGEAASLGKQAQRIADRWEQRRETVEAARAPEAPAYDSPERDAARESFLRSIGCDPDQIAERMAAAAGRGKPVSAAVKKAPEPRVTMPGAGVARAYQRGKSQGRDDNDLDR